MKKSIFIIAAIALGSLVTSCNGKAVEKKIETPVQVKETYQCPMKCENKTYDKPGKCSVCEMDLVKVSEG